ncbi:MAG: hypothetical protein AB7N91_09075 [Candidatus Tectimicrobiota bacterium]
MSAPLTLTLLKTPWVLFGVAAPRFIWCAALLIFVGTLACLLRLWWLVRREERTYQRLRTRLSSLQPGDGRPLREGLPAAMYEALGQLFRSLAAEAPALTAAWRHFEAQMVIRRDATGQEHFWTPESAALAFNDTTVVEPRVNRGFFSAIPGVASGAGLLCTFLAILIALLDVTLENEQFQGLDTLISGLSGKFLSSIAALSVATLYLLLEQRLLPRLSRGVHALAGALDDLVPRLAPARLLLAMQERLEAQDMARQQAGSDLAATVRQGVSEGMGDTLERLVRSVEELNQWLRTAEVQRAEAAHGSLETLLQQLEQSLSGTLGGMSAQFAQTMSHSTTQEFAGVTSALHGSAQLLADMNNQFLATQATLANLMEMARSSTAEQMSLGKTQVEELTTVLRDMMAHMHESAGLSVHRMAATLTAVVHDLSSRVTEMGERMSQTVTTNTGQATEAAQMMMGKVDQWSAQSTRQLAQLLEKHQAHLEQVQDVQRTMETTMRHFRSALSEYATVTSGLKNVSAQTATMLTAATTTLRTLQTTGESLERVAQLTTTQVERLASSNRQQDEVQQRLAVHLQRYQQVFQEVEHTASKLLEQIEQQLHRYMATTQQGFEHLTRAADEHFANASRHLGETVGGLDEHLQDLTDVLERLGRVGGVNGHQS